MPLRRFPLFLSWRTFGASSFINVTCHYPSETCFLSGKTDAPAPVPPPCEHRGRPPGPPDPIRSPLAPATAGAGTRSPSGTAGGVRRTERLWPREPLAALPGAGEGLYPHFSVHFYLGSADRRRGGAAGGSRLRAPRHPQGRAAAAAGPRDAGPGEGARRAPQLKPGRSSGRALPTHPSPGGPARVPAPPRR